MMFGANLDVCYLMVYLAITCDTLTLTLTKDYVRRYDIHRKYATLCAIVTKSILLGGLVGEKCQSKQRNE